MARWRDANQPKLKEISNPSTTTLQKERHKKGQGKQGELFFLSIAFTLPGLLLSHAVDLVIIQRRRPGRFVKKKRASRKSERKPVRGEARRVRQHCVFVCCYAPTDFALEAFTRQR